MQSINKVILVGNTTIEPIIKTFQNGKKNASFSLATNEYYKDKATGERKEKAAFHNIVVRGDGNVSAVERLIKKGTKLYLEGQLTYREYETKDGQKRHITEVMVGQFNGNLVVISGFKERPAQEAAPKGKPVENPQEYTFDDDAIPF